MEAKMELYNKIINGRTASKADLMTLTDYDLDALCTFADKIRKHFMGNAFDICTIINGKSGKCSEDCKYCAQSAHYITDCPEYPLLPTDKLEAYAQYNASKGIAHFSVVTSGKKLTKDEINYLCSTYDKINKECNIKLCASHGLLDYESLKAIKNAGVTRYHNNLETSEKYFKNICTTHSLQDKIRTIKLAKEAGLEVCSGGIMGLGETMEDRIDMALQLQKLNVTSVPINILNPIKNTPLEHNKILSYTEIKRIIAIYRFALPNKFIKLAGGRGLLPDKGKSLFLCGANGAISGDMLTTAGITIDEDKKMLSSIGYKL